MMHLLKRSRPLLLLTFIVIFGQSHANAQTDATKLNVAQEWADKSANTIHFAENKGQIVQTDGKPAPYVAYMLQKGGVNIYLLKEGGIAYQINRMHYPEGYQDLMADRTHQMEQMEKLQKMEKDIRRETYRMDMQLVGANAHATIVTEGKSLDYTQFYTHDALFVQHYKKVIYKDIYPGIDWVIYTTAEGIEYDFVVHPGADPAQIKLEFTHQEELYLDKNGNLIQGNRMGRFTEKTPVSFQEGKSLETRFVLTGNTVSFALGNYNPALPLTIDPARIWATYFGAGGDEIGFSCATDASGNVYLAGETASSSHIASGGHQNYKGGGNDAFLVKYNASGTRQWSTYYGGSITERALSCAADTSGNVYLTGYTNSTSSIASGGHQNSFGGGNVDAFLVKFNASGVRQWATYYGGSGSDWGRFCTTDVSGNVYLTGETELNYVMGSGGHQNTYGGGSFDAFLVKFNTSGTRLWSTFYGGTNTDYGRSCATDTSGNVYLAGSTNSSSSIASGGYQNSFAGGDYDAFLVKFNASGTRLWSTYFGGSGTEYCYSCASDLKGNLYLAGWTNSSSSIASGGYQNSYGGNEDVFLVKFNASGARQWSTYYGGSEAEFSYSCATDRWGNLYLAGFTSSTSSIASGGHQNTLAGLWDAFLVMFNSSGKRQWGTYYGGQRTEYNYSCATDVSGNIYIAGFTESNSSISYNGFQNGIGGRQDAFLAKFQSCADVVYISETACDSFYWNLTKRTYKVSGNYPDTLINVQGCDSVITLQLQINSNSSSISESACDSYFWSISGQTYTSSGLYIDTLTNAKGCDSVITLNLTILQSTGISFNEAVCESFFWNQTGKTYTKSGSYFDTLVNAVGCDSIITLNLTINKNGISMSETACDTFLWNPNGLTYTSSGTYYDTLTNTFGCDSVITLNLTVNYSDSSYLSLSTCDTYYWSLNGETYTSSGTYYDTLTNASGCDSVIYLHLTINKSNGSAVYDTASNKYFWNQTQKEYTQSGIYYDTLTNASGCDSVVSLALTIISLNTSVSQLNFVLTADESGLAYQWLNCQNNYAHIPGATNQTFVVTQNGSYAVELDNGFGLDTSICIDVLNVSVPSIGNKAEVRVYPNPFESSFVLEQQGDYTEYEVLDMLGRSVKSGDLIKGKNIIAMQSIANGTYFLKLNGENGNTLIKLIKAE